MRFLIGCLAVIATGVVASSGFVKESPPHVLAAAKVRVETANKLAKKYDMVISGAGGAMMHCVEEIGVAFTVFRPLSKSDARELVVKCVEEFLEDINASVELRPYLAVYPFEPGRVELQIFCESPPGSDVSYPNFSIVSNYKGKIRYIGRQSETDKSYKHKEYETYANALDLVNHAS